MDGYIQTLHENSEYLQVSFLPDYYTLTVISSFYLQLLLEVQSPYRQLHLAFSCNRRQQTNPFWNNWCHFSELDAAS